jgi:radical SAM superfamily enzyme YgiQ (UPF0313 family)
MKIKLVFPSVTDGAGQRMRTNSLPSKLMRLIVGFGGSNATPPLSLLVIAAATPRDIDVELVDERFDEIDFDDKVDLVGITVVTSTAPRAYQIADEFRRRNVAVVLGGIHPTVLHREAGLHADAVVVGEGEGVWPQILRDFQRDRLRPIYRGGRHGEPDEVLPRRDIVTHPERYATTKVVTATRGCENRCTFCSAGLAIGKRYRTRCVQSVIDELDSLPGRFAIFADDNLGWDVPYTKALFKALIPLNIRWYGAITLSAIEDAELVDLMAESGCAALGMGFESISPRVLTAIKKNQTNDPTHYRELIERVHGRGIPIIGNFIVGFDDDDRNVFGELAGFIRETCIEMPSVNTLIPYPGSSIFRRYDREGRLFHKDWGRYDTAAGSVVYRPRQMTPEELVEGYYWITEQIHRPRHFLRRVVKAGTLACRSTVFALYYNLRKRAGVRAEIPRMKVAF